MGHKLAPVFIGKSAHPRCFKNFDSEAEGIIYRSNSASWMLVDIFNEWLGIVNKEMADANRLILMIVDNAPVHKLLRTFTNVTVLYLPPRTSALIQPMDMGIIWSVKAAYKKKLNNYILSNISTGNGNPLKTLFILEPIAWIKNVWYNMDSKILWNCWNKSGLAHKDPEADCDILGDEGLLDDKNYEISQPSFYNEKLIIF